MPVGNAQQRSSTTMTLVQIPDAAVRRDTTSDDGEGGGPPISTVQVTNLEPPPKAPFATSENQFKLPLETRRLTREPQPRVGHSHSRETGSPIRSCPLRNVGRHLRPSLARAMEDSRREAVPDRLGDLYQSSGRSIG